MELILLTNLRKLNVSSRKYDSNIESMLLALDHYVDCKDFYLTGSSECIKELKEFSRNSLFAEYKLIFSENINRGLSKNNSLKVSLAKMLVNNCVGVNMKYAQAIADQVFLQYEINQQGATLGVHQWSYFKIVLTSLIYAIGGLASIILSVFWANDIFPVFFNERTELMCCLWLIFYLVLFSMLFNKKILGKMFTITLATETMLFMSTFLLLFPMPLK